MELVDIRDLFHHQEDYVGKKITVGGWVRSNRNSKNFGFIVVNDGTFFEPLQVVYADGLENFQELTKINVGAAIVVTGVLEATPEAKRICTGLSVTEETSQLRIFKNYFTFKTTYQYL